jgi:hypothetical protein
VGNSGRRAWTTDGVSLQDTTDTSLGDIGGVAYGNGTFVLAAANGSATSTDGKTWAKQSNIPGMTSFGGGLFLTTTWESNVYTSPDGQAWTKVFSGQSGSPALARVAWGAISGQ